MNVIDKKKIRKAKAKNLGVENKEGSESKKEKQFRRRAERKARIKKRKE